MEGVEVEVEEVEKGVIFVDIRSISSLTIQKQQRDARIAIFETCRYLPDGVYYGLLGSRRGRR